MLCDNLLGVIMGEWLGGQNFSNSFRDFYEHFNEGTIDSKERQIATYMYQSTYPFLAFINSSTLKFKLVEDFVLFHGLMSNLGFFFFLEYKLYLDDTHVQPR